MANSNWQISIITSDGTVYTKDHPDYEKIHTEWINMKNSKDWRMIFIPKEKSAY
jgi:hypothetical protein